MSEARKGPVFGSAGEPSPQIHNNQDIERLRDELTDLLYGTEGDNFDNSRLEVILDALEQESPTPDISDDAESLAAFHEKYAPVFAAVEADVQSAAMIDPSVHKKQSLKILRRILALTAVLILLLATIAHAFGFGGLVKMFSRWTSELFQADSESVPHATITKQPLEVGAEAEYDTLEDALNAFGIHCQLVPQWFPDGFELEKVTAHRASSGINIFADYVSDGKYIYIRYREITPDASNIEKDDAQVTVHTRGKIDYYIMPNNTKYKAHWENGELNCSIIGDVSREQMVKIIESIY